VLEFGPLYYASSALVESYEEHVHVFEGCFVLELVC
jgi:hypothetical protein